MARLLVSVRGPNEAVEAAKGGAHIADVEYPASALGTPYPLNIKAVRNALDKAGFSALPISTNIGEDQPDRASACQAALGVAVAGADYVKCGFAGLTPKAAAYLGRNLVRTVREWHPRVKIYPAVFPEEEFADFFDPLVDGPILVGEIDCDGLLIDTFKKDTQTNLLDYYSLAQLEGFRQRLHDLGKEAWVAGSITKNMMPPLWAIGIDVICVRGAACDATRAAARLGIVSSSLVQSLLETIR